MNDITLNNIRSQEILLINLQSLIIGPQLEIDFIPDPLIQIPLSANEDDPDEELQNINLEIFTQKIQKINQEKKTLQNAVNYLFEENKGIKEINYKLTQKLFQLQTGLENYEQRTLFVNYEFLKKVNNDLRDDNQKFKDKLLLLQIENEQQNQKIIKLEQKKGLVKQQFKDNLFFDQSVLNEINHQTSQINIAPQQEDKKEVDVKTTSSNQTANTSVNLQKNQKVTPKTSNVKPLGSRKSEVIPLKTIKKNDGMNVSFAETNKSQINSEKNIQIAKNKKRNTRIESTQLSTKQIESIIKKK